MWTISYHFAVLGSIRCPVAVANVSHVLLPTHHHSQTHDLSTSSQIKYSLPRPCHACFASCAWRERFGHMADHVCLSVRVVQLENHWMDFDKVLYGSNVIASALKSYFYISCNRQYQHGGRTSSWGVINTSASFTRAIQWYMIVDFQKIHNVGILILSIM